MGFPSSSQPPLISSANNQSLNLITLSCLFITPQVFIENNPQAKSFKMKFLAPLALLLVQGVLAAPVPDNGNTGCCQQTPTCPENPDCECPVCLI